MQKNQYYIQRSFKEVLGITPLRYLHQVRINKSKELLLKKHTYSITTIGLEVGYNDSAHFSTKFKEQEGMTPKEFRKQILK
ncbi:helix-turn-helix domain-containing protein [Terribacillus sp. JSM ZJ617]|uniref:helix-turn-helix domain-containing protein n=1 Tax=Terribacillus TaxID=459532 RepID=UPI0035A87949